MSTIRVRVSTGNPGPVNLTFVGLGSGPINESAVVDSAHPFDKTWTVLQGSLCTVTFTWATGFHNIGGSAAAGIAVNGVEQVFQVAGSASATHEIIGTFGYAA